MNRPSLSHPLPVPILLDDGLPLYVIEPSQVPIVEFRLHYPPGRDDVERSHRFVAAAVLEHSLRRRFAPRGVELRVSYGAAGIDLAGGVLAEEAEAVLADLILTVGRPSDQDLDVGDLPTRILSNSRLARARLPHALRRELDRCTFADRWVSREVPDEVHLQDALVATGTLQHDRGLGAPDHGVLLGIDVPTATALLEGLLSPVASTAVWPTRPRGEDPPHVCQGITQLLRPAGGAVGGVLLARAADIPAPVRAGVAVANAIFGGYFSSWLLQEFRETRGLVYAANTRFDHLAHQQWIVLEATSANASEFVPQLLTWARTKLTTRPAGDQVEGARDFLLGSLARAFSSQGSLATLVHSGLIWGFGSDWFYRYPELLAVVSHNEVYEALREYYVLHDFAGVVISASGNQEECE